MSDTPKQPAVAVAVTGLGFTCAVGTDAVEACAAARAGLSRVVASAYACRGPDELGVGSHYARVAAAPFDGEGRERLDGLLAAAFDELTRSAHIGRRAFAAAPLHVVLPLAPPLPNIRPNAELAALATRSRWPNSRVLLAPSGQAGMFAAVVAAVAELERGAVERALVAGVEPEPSLARLAELEAAGRLRSPGQHDGFTPGEAAAVLLLEREDAAEERVPLAFVERAAFEAGTGALEPEPLARALGRVVDRALDWVVCDLNGEAARSHAWGIAATRSKEPLGRTRLSHPSASWGDIGSATGGALVALATQAWARRYAPGDRALLWAQSDEGSAAALVLRAPTEDRPLTVPASGLGKKPSPCCAPTSMPSSLGVNARTVIHAGSGGVSSAFPDVCLTPAPPSPSPVPIPYPNIAVAADSASTASDVLADGEPVCLAGSNFGASSGDEAGSAGGVASGKNRGKATFVQYSFDVQIEGQGVPRALDLMLHNDQNTPPAPVVQPPLAGQADEVALEDDPRGPNPLATASFHRR